MAKKQAHLEELFIEGKEFEVAYPGREGYEPVTLWVERPNPVQHDTIMKQARQAQARRKAELLDKDSDEKLALELELKALSKKEIIDLMVEARRQYFVQRATNDVMHNDDYGSDWGTEGNDYLSLVDAVITRYEEIREHNIKVRAAEEPDAEIDPKEDEETQLLEARQQVFTDEVVERADQLRDDDRKERAGESITKLRDQLMKDRIERDTELKWYTTFKTWQIYFATRYGEDHQKLYFSKPDKILSLPPIIRQQIFDAFDDIDLDPESAKNSLTPLPS